MKYVIHIGVNKTGTSSIQHILMQNRAVLKENGVLFPRVFTDPTGVAHHPLSDMVKNREDLTEGVAEINRIAKAKNCHTVILSSEALYDRMTVEDVAYFASFFPKEQTQIYAYIRPHVPYFSSWYQQDIQAGDISHNFYDYFMRQKHLCYSNMLAPWLTVYEDNLNVRLYQRDHLEQGDSVKDFFKWIERYGVLTKVKRIKWENNPSITGNLLFFKQVMNTFMVKDEVKQMVRELMLLSRHRNFQGKMFVGEKMVNFINTEMANDRAYIKQHFGVDMPYENEAYAGAKVPDRDALGEDYKLILEKARELDLDIVPYLEKFTFN